MESGFVRTIKNSGGQAIAAHFLELFSNDGYAQPDMVIAHGFMMQSACSSTELALLLHQKDVHVLLAERVWHLLRTEELQPTKASIQARTFLQTIRRSASPIFIAKILTIRSRLLDGLSEDGFASLTDEGLSLGLDVVQKLIKDHDLILMLGKALISDDNDASGADGTGEPRPVNHERMSFTLPWLY